MDADDRIRDYACEVVGWAADGVTSVARFEAGNRHAVYRVSHRETDGDTKDVVVRVSIGGDPAERAQAQLEATVLDHLQGVGAPRLYDFRNESKWFETPAMCMQFVGGRQRDLSSAALDDLEHLGAVVASVHNLPVDDLLEWFPGVTTLRGYVGERLELHAAYVPRLRHPLPSAMRARVDRASSSVAASVEWARRAASFRADDRLVLLHGDVATSNVLWSPSPVLIDWEYARLGDPADEIAYVFGQHGLTASRRAAFWAGYRRATALARPADLVERAAWWEPVLLLGSALWWLERWSRRAHADAVGGIDPSAPKPQSYYLDHATRRLDRFDAAIAEVLTDDVDPPQC